MKANFLILTAIALFITMDTEAQTDKVKLYEGTDSATTIHTGGRTVWVESKDSIILIRKDLLELEDMNQKRKSVKKSEIIEELYSFSGKIKEWQYNDNFIYNGFLLQSETETRLIKFHPVLGAKIRALGDSVEVIGTIAKYKDKRNKVMGLVQIHNNKDTIYSSMTPAFHKIVFDSVNTITDSGTIKKIEYHSDKHIRRCLLDNNVVLRFLPFTDKSYPRNIKAGTTIGYIGIEQHVNIGEVKSGDYKIVHCITIFIDGKEYQLRKKWQGGYMVELEYGTY